VSGGISPVGGGIAVETVTYFDNLNGILEIGHPDLARFARLGLDNYHLIPNHSADALRLGISLASKL